MALTPGSRLGPYDIVSLLGEGGMGEVYRATDTNLKRQVALKVLPASAAAADRLARFQREAEVLAALNHPHIAQIFGVERSAGTIALVMELVEGEDLAARLTRGAIPLAEALPMARQIADALEAAHEQGIVHRDLKPANIKVRPDGTVKVLDFGLAKAMDPASPASGAAMQAATITTPAMTQAGMILGTAAYMSPEQAAGKPVDKRSDLWAFGVVLLEMLTGRRVFDGETVSHVIAAVLTKEPDWTGLPADTPASVKRLLRRSLEKDRKQRLPDAAMARLKIDDALSTPVGDTPTAAARPQPLWKRALPLAGTAMVTAGLAWAVVSRPQPSAPADVVRFVDALPEAQEWSGRARSVLALSPDGTHLAYTAAGGLYVRSLDELQPRLVVTPIERRAILPTFSPDGAHLAYYDTGDSGIKRTDIRGGNAASLAKLPRVWGMTWSGDSLFIGAGRDGIMRVPAQGGSPETVARVEPGEFADAPMLLPDGEHLLFTIATGDKDDRWDKARIVVESLRSHERKTVLENGSDGRYLRTGHLTYAVAGILYAVPFNLTTLTTSGTPVAVLEGVARANDPGSTSGLARMAISDAGTMVYIPGPKEAVRGFQHSIGLFDRQGRAGALRTQRGPWVQPRVAPDGTRIVIGADDDQNADVWLYELTGANALRRLTLDGQGRNRYPIWAADGQSVAFQSDREGDRGIFWQRVDGSRPAERLTRADDGVAHVPESWSPDGRHFLYRVSSGGTTTLWVYAMKERTAARFSTVSSPDSTLPDAVFSPDGRWVAYASREGRAQSAVYVEPFPATGAKYQISENAVDAHGPVWSPDGAELLYTPGPATYLQAVTIAATAGFRFSDAAQVPRPFRNLSPASARPYDMGPDGRIVALTADDAASGPQYHVVLNWFDELTRRVPVR